MPPDDGKDRKRTDRQVRVEIAYYLIAAVFSYYFSLLHIQKPEWEAASFDRMMDGQAQTPMQYRILTPWVGRLLLQSGISMPYVDTSRGLRFAIDAGSVFLLILAYRSYLACLLKNRALATPLSLLLALVLPFHYLLPLRTFHYAYDLPSVLFFTVGLLLLYRQKWPLYYPLFVVATLNRETSCFLTLTYLVTAWGGQPVRRMASHVFTQAALWCIIKAGLFIAYGSNTDPQYCDTAGIFKNMLLHNFNNLRQWTSYNTHATLLSSFGFTWPLLLTHWGLIGDRFARRSCAVLPLFLVGMLCVGEIAEIRIYGEMIPIVLAGFTLILSAWFSAASSNPQRVLPSSPP